MNKSQKDQKESDYKLDHLIALMEKVAAPIPAIPAIPAISPIPAIPQIITNGDHDTIVGLVKSFDNIDKKFTDKFAEVRSDIKEIKDGVASKIAALEQEKLNTKDSYPVLYKIGVEKRLDDLEKESKTQGLTITKIWSYGTAVIFVVGIIEFFISKFVD